TGCRRFCPKRCCSLPPAPSFSAAPCDPTAISGDSARSPPSPSRVTLFRPRKCRPHRPAKPRSRPSSLPPCCATVWPSTSACSAFLLFGFSYLYGLSGTTNIPATVQALGAARGALPSVVIVALVTVVAGLGFRITAVPFHFYAPDVYQGAPTSGAALLSFVPK